MTRPAKSLTSILKTRSCGLLRVPALYVLLAAAGIAMQSARAQSLNDLYLFNRLAAPQNGYGPRSELLRDAAGNLYGTTGYGGNLSCDTTARGCGTIFKLDPTGTLTILHRFAGGSGGALPYSGLIRDAQGNLYGTTYGDDFGAGCSAPNGCGTVFKLDRAGNLTVLHRFHGPDGASPSASLIRDATGNLYGTTASGGDTSCSPPSGCGTVFKLDQAGNLKVLHRFEGGTDGIFPQSALVHDFEGNLYGTTAGGGDSGYGTIFKITRRGQETIVYSFKGIASGDGEAPEAGLVRDTSGNLYGTTIYGGADGLGTIFKISASGEESVLYSFSGTDGRLPAAGLTFDASGSLYGTTEEGGNLNACKTGCGVIFKLDKTGKETVLYAFTVGEGGATPAAGVILDSAGNLYGTTVNGGILFDAGVVFELTP